MTYYEAYSACQNEEQIKEKALRDTKVAVFLGNPDRIKEIEEAMNRAIADKAESETDEILEKVNRCHRRIVDSSYCERSDCEKCDCFVPTKDIQTAREVLKLRGDKAE